MRKSQSFAGAAPAGPNQMYDGWNGQAAPDNFGGAGGIGRGRAGFGPPAGNQPTAGWGGQGDQGFTQGRGGGPPRGRLAFSLLV